MTALTLLLAAALILYHLIGFVLSAPDMGRRPFFLAFQVLIHALALSMLGLTIARAW